VELIETSIFTKQITALLTDEVYGHFQAQLVKIRSWAHLSGGGGIRKIRLAVGGRGKSGGARVIYFWAVRQDVILLIFAYAKNDTADLTPKQIVKLAKLVKEEFGNETRDV